MASEMKRDGNRLVKKINIIGTQVWAYSAWERDPSPALDTPFRTITHIDNERYGKIGSDDRSRGAEARTLIEKLFPEAAAGRWDDVLYEVEIYA